MSLLDDLQHLSALACDTITDAVESVGAEVQVSVIISHPGRGADDALVVGSHTLDELGAIVVDLIDVKAQGGVEAGTVTQSGYTPDEAPTLN